MGQFFIFCFKSQPLKSGLNVGLIPPLLSSFIGLSLSRSMTPPFFEYSVHHSHGKQEEDETVSQWPLTTADGIPRRNCRWRQ